MDKISCIPNDDNTWPMPYKNSSIWLFPFLVLPAALPLDICPELTTGVSQESYSMCVGRITNDVRTLYNQFVALCEARPNCALL